MIPFLLHLVIAGVSFFQGPQTPVVAGAVTAGSPCIQGSPFYANLQTGIMLSCQNNGTIWVWTQMNWLNPTGSAIYNQGSPNAVNQSVTNRLQQELWFTDFADNVGNAVSPAASPTTNAVGIQNAVNWAAAHAQILHCSGEFNTNAAIQIPTGGEVQIYGEGVTLTINPPTNVPGSCIVNQTNPLVAVFSVTNTNSTDHSVSPITFRHLMLRGGTNNFEFINNGPPGSANGGGPFIFDQVAFQYFTHAGIYWDGNSLTQGLYTTLCHFTAGSNTAIGIWHDAVPVATNPLGFFTEWHSTDDLWGGGLHGIYVDSDQNSGGWTLTNPRFQDMYGSPIVLLGGIGNVSITNYGGEATGAGDNGGSLTNPQWNYTTGTTTTTNSATIAVADSTRFKIGDTIHIAQAGGTTGTPNAGIDFDTVIQSCTPNACGTAGANTFNVSPPIPLIVTGVYTTNSQSNGIELLASPVNPLSSPGNIYLRDSAGCIDNFTIGDAGSCRYTVYAPNGATVGLYNIGQGAPNYDPFGYFTPNINVESLETAPFNYLTSLTQPNFRAFDGNRNYPTNYSGNPGQGEIHWACGSDPGRVCNSTGKYGSAMWVPNAANKRPYFTINYDTGLVSVGPAFNCCAGVFANLSIGAIANAPQGANNSLDLVDGTAPSSHTPGANQLVAISGVLYHYNPSGTAINLDGAATGSTTYYSSTGGPALAMQVTSPVQTFNINLNGANITSSTIAGANFGNLLIFAIQQLGPGSSTWTWPPNFIGGGTIGTTVGKENIQQFVYIPNGSYYSLGAMQINQ